MLARILKYILPIFIIGLSHLAPATEYDDWMSKVFNINQNQTPFNPNTNSYDPDFHPLADGIAIAQAKNTVYMTVRKNSQTQHTFMDYQNNSTISFLENSWAETQSSNNLLSTTKGIDFDTTMYSSTSGDVNGDGQEEIVNVYYDYNNKALYVRIIGYADQQLAEQIDGTDDSYIKVNNHYQLINVDTAPYFGAYENDNLCKHMDARTANSQTMELKKDILVVQYCGKVMLFQSNNADGINDPKGDAYKYGYSHTYTYEPSKLFDVERISIATGDVDNDFKDDLIIAVSRKEKAGRSFMLFNKLSNDGKFSSTSHKYITGLPNRSYSNKDNSDEQFHPMAITIGNVDNNKANEIIIGGGLYNYSVDGMGVIYWKLDDTQDTGEQKFLNGHWGQVKYWKQDISTGKNNDTRALFPNIITWDPFGWGQGRLIVYGKKILQHNWNNDGNDNELHEIAEVDYPVKHMKSSNSLAKHNKASFVLANYAVGNILNMTKGDPAEDIDNMDTAKEELFIAPYIIHKSHGKEYFSSKTDAYILTVPSVPDDSKYSIDYPMNVTATNPYNLDEDGEAISYFTPVFLSGNKDKALMHDYYAGGSDNLQWSPPQPVIADFTGKSLKVRYKHEHRLVYTAPLIFAALAYPPFNQGTAQRHGTSISFSQEVGEGHGETKNNTHGTEFGVGVKFKFESKFNVFGVEIPGPGFEFKNRNFFGNTWSKVDGSIAYDYSGFTISLNDSAFVDDLLILTITPYDIYTYEVLSEPGNELEVEVARKPVLTGMTVTEYNDIVAPNTDLPFKKEKLWHHSLGDAHSYKNYEDFLDISWDDNTMYYNSQGLLASSILTTQWLSQSETIIDEHTKGSTFRTTNELQVGAGGFYFVNDDRYFNNNTVTTINRFSTSRTIKATVGALQYVPGGDYNYNNRFSWGLFSYVKEVDGRDILVLDYWVR